jgi:hypothetical protein
MGTPLERKFEKIMPPFQRFTHDQVTGSILLIICTLTALLVANSSLNHGYEALLLTRTGLVFGDWSLTMSLHHWINEGMMSLFFFVLGVEIKRELLVGELKSRRQSIPMIAAALGGMLMPALIFTAFTAGTPLVHGWGIPMATPPSPSACCPVAQTHPRRSHGLPDRPGHHRRPRGDSRDCRVLYQTHQPAIPGGGRPAVPAADYP